MSLRKYIFVLLTSLVLIIAGILSFQSAYIFIHSLDKKIEYTMYKVSKDFPEAGHVEQTVLGYHATTDWQKVPPLIRDKFPEMPTQAGVLQTQLVDWVYFLPPKKSYSLIRYNRGEQAIFVSYANENIHQELAEKYPERSVFLGPVIKIVLLGFLGIGVFVFALLYLFKKIAVPVESLQSWAQGFQLSDLNNARPDFTFTELNELAGLIHNNLASVADSVEREQNFLSYASHELRTPIAVLRSNSALLEKVNPNPSDKEREIRNRLQRASLTMKSMTDTLLWLSRKGETDMRFETTNLGALVQNIASEVGYLLVGKKVEVNLEVDELEVPLAITPSIIVLNNLIRNAFQHTQHGRVDIVQKADEVTITNVEFDADNAEKLDAPHQHSHETANTHDELGFGLGMQLVEKLSAQFGWHYLINKEGIGYQVSVSFSSSNN